MDRIDAWRCSRRRCASRAREDQKGRCVDRIGSQCLAALARVESWHAAFVSQVCFGMLCWGSNRRILRGVYQARVCRGPSNAIALLLRSAFTQKHDLFDLPQRQRSIATLDLTND